MKFDVIAAGSAAQFEVWVATLVLTLCAGLGLAALHRFVERRQYRRTARRSLVAEGNGEGGGRS